MLVEVSTEIPCSEHGGTAVVPGTLDTLATRSPSTVSSTCKPDGTIGTLVIVPSGDEGDEVAFQVMTGIGVDPSTCNTAVTSSSCIVARRSLRFLPHESLHI